MDGSPDEHAHNKHTHALTRKVALHTHVSTRRVAHASGCLVVENALNTCKSSHILDIVALLWSHNDFAYSSLAGFEEEPGTCLYFSTHATLLNTDSVDC